MARFLRATLVVLVIGTLFLYPLLAPTPHRIDEAHFELIRDGMTEAEVEAIFGAPAGSYDWARPTREYIWLIALLQAQQQFEYEQLSLKRDPANPQKAAIRFMIPALGAAGGETKNWISRHGAFSVSLDDQGHVVGKRDAGPTRIEFPWQSWWQKLTGK